MLSSKPFKALNNTNNDIAPSAYPAKEIPVMMLMADGFFLEKK
jgi:hypothetical protein